MPIRHEDDYRRKHIASWDSWIEDALRESQERGEFDNLPDAGKPIKLEDTPFAPEMASALRTLKNAGYEPTWMELDRRITQARQDLQTYLNRSAAYVRTKEHELHALERAPVDRHAGKHHSRWQRWWQILRHGSNLGRPEPRALSWHDLVQIRAAMREQYLERAAAADKLIVDFHAALPRNLWHLERLRITPEHAARTFDESIPAIGLMQVS
jgi:hypothetical protein